MNPTIEIPKRVDEFRAALEPQRVLHPNECGIVQVPAGVDAQIEYPAMGGMIPKGPWNRQKPTELGGELLSYSGQSRILGGMGRYYAESIVDGPGSMDLTTDWDEFTIRWGAKQKKWRIKAATTKTTSQSLEWTRSLLEQLTQTEMEVTAARFRIASGSLPLKGPK